MVLNEEILLDGVERLGTMLSRLSRLHSQKSGRLKLSNGGLSRVYRPVPTQKRYKGEKTRVKLGLQNINARVFLRDE